MARRYLRSVKNLVAGLSHWQLHVARHSQDAKAQAVLRAATSGSLARQRTHAVYGVVRGDIAAVVDQIAPPQQRQEICDGVDRIAATGTTATGTLVAAIAELLVDPAHPDHDALLSEARLLGWCVEIARTPLPRSLPMRLLHRRFADATCHPRLVELFDRALDPSAQRTRSFLDIRLPVEAALLITGADGWPEVDLMTLRHVLTLVDHAEAAGPQRWAGRVRDLIASERARSPQIAAICELVWDAYAPASGTPTAP
jgi:hypothetical protein